MSVLAEEIVEEWLNRQGYFTIRGIKLGVDEIDILAIRPKGKQMECRHIEVQASMRPVSYISKVPKAEQKKGRSLNSAKRSNSDLQQGVREWVDKKFCKPRKLELMKQLYPADWTKELVLNVVKSNNEVALIQEQGISILYLSDIVDALKQDGSPIKSASGADFIDLIQMGQRQEPKQGE